MLSQKLAGPLRGRMIAAERSRVGIFGIAIFSCLALAGCKSDLNQQLLERELRYQEDQIYQLQDELQDKCGRLEMLAGENTSLRRQLGVSDTDAVGRSQPGRPRSPASSPLGVPPAIRIPEAISRPAAPGSIAPPALDNIPPLPVKPSSAPEPSPLSLPEPGDATGPPAPMPPTAATVPAAVPDPATRPVAYDQPLTDGRPVRLVVNTTTTSCFDDNGDGRSDGLTVTFEPRDGDERLVPVAGDVAITAFDTADPSVPLAMWTIPSEQAATHFRRTTRLRGMHFPLRWTGTPPAGDHVRVVVRVTGPEGAVLEADATIPAR
ncbi:MAG: hypothetical protein ACR2IT_01885 [Pirellulales bacterium]